MTGAATRLAAAQLAADTAVPGDLLEADLARLIRAVEPSSSALDIARAEDLLRDAVSDLGKGETASALEKLAELVRLDPQRAESLRTEPGFAAIRASVEQLLSRLETLARMDAQGRLGRAAQALDAVALRDWDAPPETLLGLAQRLLDAGGYANSVRAAGLADALVNATRWAPADTAPPAEDPPAARRGAVRGVGALWSRAPLLVLLLGWLSLGLAGGAGWLWFRRFEAPGEAPSWVSAGFEIWALGFLALVSFGFYMRVRDIGRG